MTQGGYVGALVVAVSVGGLLAGLASAWHEIRLARRELPLHVALRRFRASLAPERLRKAEARCRRCPLRRTCMRGLVRYEDLPPACPNLRLFR